MTPPPLFTHCRGHNTITPSGRPCPQCAQIEEIKTLRAALKAAEREAAASAVPVLRDPMEETQMMPVYVRRHRMREARDLHAVWIVAETVRYMLARIARGKRKL